MTASAGPKRKPTKRTEAPGYDKYRSQQADIARKASAGRREIGGIPPIADVARRDRCRKSLKEFCETYNPAAFHMAWSDDQLRSLARIEEAATRGAMYAFAEPRGSGKTTRCRMAALWAVSYGYCRYLYLLGANAEKAKDSLAAIKTMVRFLPEYAADFPEISYPATMLGGIANRAAGQTCGGESTLIEWGQDRIVLPTVRPPDNWPAGWPLRADGMVPTAGAVLGTSGLTGDGIRGSVVTLTTGEQVRPDFVILDDPQTDESAKSPSQNATREELIGGAVLGMAGPGRPIAAVMPCTVIAPGDCIDRILDRTRHPLWRGERSRLLRSMPADMAAWKAYFEVYADCAQAEPPDFGPANAYYLAHRAELDAGAEAAWDARKGDGDVSAVQHAMHLYFRNPRVFWAEYQNEPLEAELLPGALTFDPAAVLARERMAGTPRGSVPREGDRLTAFIDIGDHLLWYGVVAWDGRFGGTVIEYGTHPAQSRAYFKATDPRPGLADVYPGLSKSQRVFAGLSALLPRVVGAEYPREVGGGLRVSRCLVDSGDGDTADAVLKAVRASPLAALVYPSKGVGRSLTQVEVGRWKLRDGERSGWNWKLTAPAAGRGRGVQFDTDVWKTFLHERLTTPPGGAGALTLFGDDPKQHALLADHLAAEYAEPQEVRGGKFQKWVERPHHPDNHWLDVLTGCCVAASVDGLAFHPGGDPPAPARRARVKLSEQQQAKRRAGQ